MLSPIYVIVRSLRDLSLTLLEVFNKIYRIPQPESLMEVLNLSWVLITSMGTIRYK